VFSEVLDRCKSYAEGLRRGAIELAGQAEDFGGRELMGELWIRRGVTGLAAYVAGFAVPTCIHKNHSVGAADGFRHFRQELKQLQNLYFRGCQSPGNSSATTQPTPSSLRSGLPYATMSTRGIFVGARLRLPAAQLGPIIRRWG
jgi:hypothetical protein